MRGRPLAASPLLRQALKRTLDDELRHGDGRWQQPRSQHNRSAMAGWARATRVIARDVPVWEGGGRRAFRD